MDIIILRLALSSLFILVSYAIYYSIDLDKKKRARDSKRYSPDNPIGFKIR